MLDLDHVHLPWDIPHVEHGDPAVANIEHATNFYALWGSSKNFRTRSLGYDADYRHSTLERTLTSFDTAADKALSDEVRHATKQALATAKTDLETADQKSAAEPQGNVDPLEGGQNVHVISATPKKHDHPAHDATPVNPRAHQLARDKAKRTVATGGGEPFKANEGESYREAGQRIALALLHREDKTMPGNA